MKINSLPCHLLTLKLITIVWVVGLFSACTPDEDDSRIDPIIFSRLLEEEKVKSNILKREINYAVLLPENYNKTTDSFPVVYLLHGYGDNQSAWYKFGLIEYYSDLYATQNGSMIFVMPQAFNTYYVNKYNGIYPYMDFLTSELVPLIDSLFRTKKDKSQRAVMGYSMGGYGALILPVMNPEVFSVSVPLSMSFRTDEQYIVESQTTFDNQWASVFGGYGAVGTERLTDYFLQHSPFHFFSDDDILKYSSLKFFIDCGDDEESLSITNGELHNLLKNKSIAHEYRVRNGGHSWDYWKKSLPEALKFISAGFLNVDYPQKPDPILIENPLTTDKYLLQEFSGENIQLGIYKPQNYNTDTNLYPAIFIFHDYENYSRSENALKLLSVLHDKMLNGKLPQSLIFEIPVTNQKITAEVFSSIMQEIRMNYRLKPNFDGLILMGNKRGGLLASSLILEFPATFNGCFLFDASLEQEVMVAPDQFYYVEVSDKADMPERNFNLYRKLRENGNEYEYRVHQGTTDFESTLFGINESVSYLSKKLKNL